MKLIKIKKITGKIETKTGLRIGGSSDIIEIGGVDNPVIRDAMNDYPYIPGSSLKGKIRVLLEWYLGKVKDNNPHYCNDDNCFICRAFGISAGKNDGSRGPGRLLFRDAYLTDDSKNKMEKLKKEKGLNYTEIKMENSINRLNSRANPRTMERVPAGVSFDFSVVYKIFDLGNEGKDDKENYNLLLKGLKLLELDALGGSGSRGYGKIKFVDLKDEEGKDILLDDIDIQGD